VAFLRSVKVAVEYETMPQTGRDRPRATTARGRGRVRLSQTRSVAVDSRCVQKSELSKREDASSGRMARAALETTLRWGTRARAGRGIRVTAIDGG
jgi:hypothetical protein